MVMECCWIKSKASIVDGWECIDQPACLRKQSLQCEVSLRTGRYMAKREIGSDVSKDLTRESLIALSYSLPDSDLPPTELPKSVKTVEEAKNTNEQDKVRYDLISISYAESPDNKGSLVSPVKNKG